MKNMMKKTLSVIIALAMILVPMSVFAATGDYEEPYQLIAGGGNLVVYLEAGASAYVQADDCNNSTVTVGYATNDGYFIQYGVQSVYPEADATASFTMNEYSNMFTVNNTGEEAVTVYMALEAGAASTAGTWDNPEEITLSDPWGWGQLSAWVEQPLDAGNQGYYYTVTAPDDGALVVGIDAYDAEWNPVGWTYNVNNVTAGIYGDYHFSDDAEPVYQEMVEVSAGDEVQIFVTTYDPADMWNAPAGTVSVNVTFAGVGSYDYPAEAVLGSQTAPVVNGNGYHYVWTATEDGTATVTMNDATGWQYSLTVVPVSGDYSEYVYGDTHFSDDDPVVASESMAMKAGDTLEIAINTYDPEAWGISGDVNWTLEFTTGSTGDGGDGDGDQGGEDIGGGDTGDEDGVNYVNSDTLLVVGDNACVVDGGYEYTIYTFEPTEEGEYTITSDDSVMGIVSYNGMWLSVDPSADTVNANELVWECTGVGQSIWVAVKADTNVANITITRAELDTSDEIPWVDYENMETPEAFTFEDDADKLVYVDVEDDVDDNMNVYYNDEDGYYHYGAEDGPIIYVNLDESMMSMVGVVSNGKLVGANYDIESGEVTEYVNCTNAIMEYIAAADTVETADGTLTLYPLTDDLIVMYIACGSYMGWYGEDGWLGLDTPDAWMFACYYVDEVPGGSNEGNEGEDNTGDDNTGDIAGDNAGDNAGDDNTGNVADPEIPNTDNEAFGVAIAMMATVAALGATVVTTKKSKRVK